VMLGHPRATRDAAKALCNIRRRSVSLSRLSERVCFGKGMVISPILCLHPKSSETIAFKANEIYFKNVRLQMV